MSGCNMKFGCAQTTQIPIVEVGGKKHTEPTVIASLRVDISKVCGSCVKLDFVANPLVMGVTVCTENFQVYKRFDGQTESIPVGTGFRRKHVLGESIVSFFIADCDMTCSSNNSCVTYTVVYKTENLSVEATSYITIYNATLAATMTTGCGCGR